MPESDSDQHLMARLQNGDDLALNDLMARWQQPLANFLFRHIGNEAVALDLTEEVFVRLYESRDRYEGRAKLSTWLYTIATNLSRNHHRWRARHPNISLEETLTPDSPSALGDILPAPTPTPSDAAASHDTARLVREAIAALPEDQCAVVILSEYENLSHAEIAQILNCTPKAVETRLYRARQALRESLKSLAA